MKKKYKTSPSTRDIWACVVNNNCNTTIAVRCKKKKNTKQYKNENCLLFTLLLFYSSLVGPARVCTFVYRVPHYKSNLRFCFTSKFASRYKHTRLLTVVVSIICMCVFKIELPRSTYGQLFGYKVRKCNFFSFLTKFTVTRLFS